MTLQSDFGAKITKVKTALENVFVKKTDITTSFSSTTSDSKVASEKLVKDSLDAKASSSHTHTVSNITDFPTIPSKISDLTNDSDFIETSSTNGLVKNDGSIDTTTYLSSLPSHSHDDRYYTENEIDTALNGKADSVHTHNDRYYTKSEVNTALNNIDEITSIVLVPKATNSDGKIIFYTGDEPS